MTRRQETADRAAAMAKLEKLKGKPDKIKETDLEVAVRELSTAFLRCRDKHHSFPKDYEDWTWERTQYGTLVRSAICENCTMEVIERLRWDGDIYSRTYKPPPGYYLVGTKDRKLGLKVRLVRQEVIRRVMGAQ